VVEFVEKMGAYYDFVVIGAVGATFFVMHGGQAFSPGFLVARSHSSSLQLHATKPQPIDPRGWPEKFPAKDHCSKCGLCETSYVSHVTDACAFLGDGMARNIDGMEPTVHGRRRRHDFVWSDISRNNGANSIIAEEGRFGVMTRPMQLAKGKNVDGAQWTGVVTGIAVSMLESGMVDAVICIASNGDGDDWSNPQPILARTVDEVLRGRGVKPALAPSLAVLDKLKDSSTDVRKLLFCGVGCAVQAFRAVQHELQLDEVYVLGTNCADNSPTPEAAKEFLSRSFKDKLEGKRVRGYEFMQDFRVHVKYDGGTEQSQPSYERLPYFSLQGDLAEFAIAKSCLACFDYTNALADVVVGYMGAPLDSSMDASFQTITVRNKSGERMLKCALGSGRLQLGPDATGYGSHEKFASTTVSSDNIVQKMVGGEMKSEGMPRLFGELMATLMSAAGPKGVNFARYSLDYHILRNYLHALDFWGERTARNMIPAYSLEIVDKYLVTDKAFNALAETIKSKR
jgi:coenzyme F420-reducing hydrogenase beta subunit